MQLVRGLDWRTLSMELFIVFVGLLAALQVDEWREHRAYRDAETRYLMRLQADLDAFINGTRRMLDAMEERAAGVAHVKASLQAGEIVDGNVALFEYGVIYVGHLPSTVVHRSAYDEMVAAGMFARLRSEGLKREIAILYAMQNMVDRNFSWWRDSVLDLGRLLDSLVEYHTEDATPSDNYPISNEPLLRRVRFEFDALQENRAVRNGFYWAEDTHSDWVGLTQNLLEIAEAASNLLREELELRR